MGNFWNFQKQPKENNPPIGENSPNLVTLINAYFSSKLPVNKSAPWWSGVPVCLIICT
jgi:hypothetical protein